MRTYNSAERAAIVSIAQNVKQSTDLTLIALGAVEAAGRMLAPHVVLLNLFGFDVACLMARDSRLDSHIHAIFKALKSFDAPLLPRRGSRQRLVV